jgi:hypothetical protein
LKAGTAITMANQLAPLGRTPSGAMIFEIAQVPDDVSDSQVWFEYRYYALGYLGKSAIWK